jgi:YtkA-like
MARRLVVALTVAMTGASLAAGPASAGGWATVGLDSVPNGIRAGEPWVVRLTILQHGRAPLEGVEPELTISKAGGATARTFAATPTERPGVYRATVVFPSAGSWRYVVDDGFSARHSFGPARIAAPGAGAKVPLAAAVPGAGGGNDEGGGGGSLGLALAAALAAGLIAAGVVLVFRRRPGSGPTPTEG